MSDANGDTPEEPVGLRVRAELRKITAPLREQLDEIDRRMVVLNREASELRESRKAITQVLEKLEPRVPAKEAPTAKAGATKLAAKQREAKTQAVLEFLQKRDNSKGFTGGALATEMKEAGVTPVISDGMTREIINDLHDRGIVRADKVVKGGGMSYMVVGRNPGGSK